MLRVTKLEEMGRECCMYGTAHFHTQGQNIQLSLWMSGSKNVGPKTFSLSKLTIGRIESGVTVSAYKTQLEGKYYVTTLHLTTCEVRLDIALSVPAGLQRKWSSCYREQRRQGELGWSTTHGATHHDKYVNAERRTKRPLSYCTGV